MPEKPQQLQLWIGDARFELSPASGRGRPLPNPRLPNKGLMLKREVAEYLSVSEKQVERWLEEGALVGVAVNADPADAERIHRRVKTESVQRFMESAARLVS